MATDNVWSNRVLIPFWVVQMIFEFIVILLLMALIADEEGSFDILSSADVIFMVCTIAAFVLEPLTMLLKSYRSLKPWLFLQFQILKAVFATAFWAYELSRFVAGDDTPIAPLNSAKAIFQLVLLVNIIFGIVMALTFYASLGYAISVFRQQRSWGERYSEKEPSAFLEE